MRKAVLGTLALVALAFAGRTALAASPSEGTLITNIASASFQSAGGVKWLVTFNVTVNVLVQNPAIGISKVSSPTVQAAGGDVTFTVCVRNTSPSVSAFNIVVTDQIGANLEFRGPSSGWNLSGSAWFPMNASVFAGPYATGDPSVGVDGPYWLRWSTLVLGPSDSACVSYIARVL